MPINPDARGTGEGIVEAAGLWCVVFHVAAPVTVCACMTCGATRRLRDAIDAAFHARDTQHAEALRKYGRHLDVCLYAGEPLGDHDADDLCDCGLDALLAPAPDQPGDIGGK